MRSVQYKQWEGRTDGFSRVEAGLVDGAGVSRQLVYQSSMHNVPYVDAAVARAAAHVAHVRRPGTPQQILPEINNTIYLL